MDSGDHTVLSLSGYEANNLRHFLEWAQGFANTGDWYHQLLYKLPSITDAERQACCCQDEELTRRATATLVWRLERP